MRKCLKICFIKFSEKSYHTESQTRDDKRSVHEKNGKKSLLYLCKLYNKGRE